MEVAKREQDGLELRLTSAHLQRVLGILTHKHEPKLIFGKGTVRKCSLGMIPKLYYGPHRNDPETALWTPPGWGRPGLCGGWRTQYGPYSTIVVEVMQGFVEGSEHTV